MRTPQRFLCLSLCIAALLALAAAPAGDIPTAIRAAVDAKDRSPEDRALDAGRHPDQMLAFFGIRPGMRVAELGAGGGYTTELLARTVGPEGRVYGHNTPFILERFAAKPWSERLAKPVMKGVVRLDRSFDEPFSPDLKDLDAVLIVLLYHDAVWMGADRAKMNRAVFAALAPGGVYGIVDHSAKPGTGVADVESLHRIDEAAVISEVKAAGFELQTQGDFLRNPADTRDWSASPRVAGERRGTSDRFALKFVKPRGQARR
jgi:predicted methyltransferase